MTEKKQRIEEVFIFDQIRLPMSAFRVIHDESKREDREEATGLWDKAFEALLDERRRQIASDPRYFDGHLLSFAFLNNGDGPSRLMGVRDTRYSTHKTMEARLLADPSSGNRLTRTQNVVAFVETADGKIVLGYRSGSSEDFGGMYLPPAGFSTHKGKVGEDYFGELSKEEIREEIGVDLKEGRMLYLGFVGGTDTRCTSVLTYTKLNHTSEEVEKLFRASNEKLRSAGKRLEHDHLIYLPIGQSDVAAFLAGDYDGELNQYAHIAFENGVFAQGPELVLGKSYQQIGEGIGGFINLMGILSGWDAANELERGVKESGIVGRISHIEPNSKLLYNKDMPL